MARIDLPKGVTGSENLPRTRRLLQNLINTGEGRVIARPGINQLTTTGKVARGQFKWNGSLYQVVSDSLIKITNTTTGANSTVGTIDGSAVIRTAIGFNHAVIVVKGGKSYTLDKLDALTDTSGNSNFVPFDDVTHINGRFVYIPSDGSPAKFSDVGAGQTIQGTSFFDAEELPDSNNGVFNFRNTLYICGTDSIQPFSDEGRSPVPFVSIKRSRILNGFISGLLEYNNTFLFIGREKDQDVGIYALSQGGAGKISNEYIDGILITYTETELQTAIASRYKWRGFDVATFTLPNHSFGYFGGEWHLLETIVDGDSGPWKGGFITAFNNEYFSASDDKIGKLANVNTDFGNPVTYIVDMGFEQENGEAFTCQAIELGISQGYNSSVGSVALMMSRDNVLYGPPVFRNLGDLGEYDKTLRWNPPGGLGHYQPFMGVRLYSAESIDFSADYLVAHL